MILVLILFSIGSMLLFLALRSLRAHRLKERYAIMFLFLGLPFFGLALWPWAVAYLADVLGIEYPTVLLLCVTTFFLLTTHNLLCIASVQEGKINALAQLVGILMEGRDTDTPESPIDSRPTPSQ